MTRKSVSNAFALAGVALAVCGLVFSSNAGVVTLAIFGGWVCLLGTLGFRLGPKSNAYIDDQGYEYKYDRSVPYNPFRSLDEN